MGLVDCNHIDGSSTLLHSLFNNIVLSIAHFSATLGHRSVVGYICWNVPSLPHCLKHIHWPLPTISKNVTCMFVGIQEETTVPWKAGNVFKQKTSRLWDWRALTRPAKPIVVFYNYRWWIMCHSKNMARLFISKLNMKLKKLISVCGDFGVQCIWTWWCVLKCRNRRPSHDEKNRTSGESQPWLSPISTNWLYCMQFEPWSSFSNCTRTECRTIVVLSKFFFQASKSLAFCLSKWLNHHDWHPKASCFAFVQ